MSGVYIEAPIHGFPYHSHACQRRMLPSQLINQTLQAARLQYGSGQCVFADAHARAYGKFLLLARFLPHEARTFPADLLPCCFSRITTLHGHGKGALCSTWLLAPCKLRSLKTASYTGISSPRCTSLAFPHTAPMARRPFSSLHGLL